MVIRRVGVFSLAKVSGALYAVLGLLIGACISLFSVIGSSFAPKDSAFGGMIFGVAAIVVVPIFYGVLGFIMSAIMAAIYNLIASWVGGVEIEVQ